MTVCTVSTVLATVVFVLDCIMYTLCTFSCAKAAINCMLPDTVVSCRLLHGRARGCSLSTMVPGTHVGMYGGW